VVTSSACSAHPGADGDCPEEPLPASDTNRGSREHARPPAVPRGGQRKESRAFPVAQGGDEQEARAPPFPQRGDREESRPLPFAQRRDGEDAGAASRSQTVRDRQASACAHGFLFLFAVFFLVL
jgi:hypothetical protein